MTTFDYDVAVIGSGPSGQRAAVQAAKLDRRTLLVECKAAVGGVCINTEPNTSFATKSTSRAISCSETK